jgi:hypothetical protein
MSWNDIDFNEKENVREQMPESSVQGHEISKTKTKGGLPRHGRWLDLQDRPSTEIRENRWSIFVTVVGVDFVHLQSSAGRGSRSCTTILYTTAATWLVHRPITQPGCRVGPANPECPAGPSRWCARAVRALIIQWAAQGQVIESGRLGKLN